MGWGLNHKDATKEALSWLVSCKTCSKAMPIVGCKAKMCSCAVRDGEFDMDAERFCDEHPSTIWRRKIIDKVNKKGE